MRPGWGDGTGVSASLLSRRPAAENGVVDDSNEAGSDDDTRNQVRNSNMYAVRRQQLTQLRQ